MRLSQDVVRRIVWSLWGAVAVLVVAVAYKLLFMTPQETGQESFPPLQSSDVVRAPTGHAYKYILAPNITWAAARDGAARYVFEGHKGYLATIDDKAEFDFIMSRVFPNGYDTDTTFLGGRQTAKGEWRWVTGPDAAADGGKGVLFWTGYRKRPGARRPLRGLEFQRLPARHHVGRGQGLLRDDLFLSPAPVQHLAGQWRAAGGCGRIPGRVRNLRNFNSVVTLPLS